MPKLSEEAVLKHARRAAELLVADLEEGQRVSGDWSDRGLADAWLDVVLERCLRRLIATDCWGEANQLPSTEFWQAAESWLERGVLQHRARFKPRGYAGDYELLEWICARRACDDPLGSAFDRYFLRQAAPEAVRGRTEQAAAAVAVQCLRSAADVCRVVSVGSGPAGDVWLAANVLPEMQRERLRVDLLDLDPDALEFAQNRLQKVLPAEAVGIHRENLFRLAKRKSSQVELGTPDVLICSGLFDYLDDTVAAEMLGLFWRQLAEGGMLLVSNFAPHNPTRAYMEWVGNWRLLYRTTEQMRQLGLAAGIPEDCFYIGSEPMGIDLVLTARKLY